MARTALTPTAEVANTFTAKAAGTAIAGLVADGASVVGPLETLRIEVEHTTASEKDVTISAGDSPPALEAGVGSVVQAFAAGDSTPVIKVLDGVTSGRFSQSDGKIHIDFETGMTGTIRVYRRASV